MMYIFIRTENNVDSSNGYFIVNSVFFMHSVLLFMFGALTFANSVLSVLSVIQTSKHK